MRVLVLVLVLGAVLAAAAPAAGAGERGPRLAPPVRGEVVRAFAYAGDPFARGHHRGLDLAAAPGAAVRAACSGRVTFAGSVGASGRVVTIRCGAWSVTHLPLRDLAVRAGERVVTGAPIGTVAAAPGHAGLHLGVRRATDRFGYVDPAPLLARSADRRRAAAGPPPRPAARPHVPPTATPPSAGRTRRRHRTDRVRARRRTARARSSPRGPPGPGSRCCCSARSAPARCGVTRQPPRTAHARPRTRGTVSP